MSRFIDDDWQNAAMRDPLEYLQQEAEKKAGYFDIWDDPEDLYEDDSLPYLDEID